MRDATEAELDRVYHLVDHHLTKVVLPLPPRSMKQSNR